MPFIILIIIFTKSRWRNNQVESQWLWSDDRLRASGMCPHYWLRDSNPHNHSPFGYFAEVLPAHLSLLSGGKIDYNLSSVIIFPWLAVAYGSPWGSLLLGKLITDVLVSLSLKKLSPCYKGTRVKYIVRRGEVVSQIFVRGSCSNPGFCMSLSIFGNWSVVQFPGCK